MARYIDAEVLTDHMLERYNDLCEKHGDYDHYTTGYGDAIDAIENAPTEDVAPMSEVHRLKTILYSYSLQYGTVRDQQKVIDDAKREVAREICCKIEEEIVAALESNYKAKAERMAKPHIEMSDEFISYCDGKIHALRGIKDFIEELKKKYTEDGE